jgi:hypothetical protein
MTARKAFEEKRRQVAALQIRTRREFAQFEYSLA